jgi:hypothetical protein
MLRVMRQYPRPTTFLRNLLVKEETVTNKTVIEIDQVFGNQGVAAYTSRSGGPEVIGKDGFKTMLHFAPYSYTEMPYTSEDLDVRSAGSTVYDEVDPAASMIARHLGKMDDKLTRLEELQIAQALQTGKITVAGRDVNYEIDFGMAASHLITLAGGAKWDTPATRDILGNLQTWSSLIADTGAPAPDFLVGDTAAMGYLISDSTIKDMLDNRRIEAGRINYKEINGQRCTYIGNLMSVGINLDLYAYQGKYGAVNTGTLTSYMNSKTVILGSSQADLRFHYARIENTKAPGFRGKRLPYQYETPNGRSRFLAMESSPLFGYHQPDAFVSAVVA